MLIGVLHESCLDSEDCLWQSRLALGLALQHCAQQPEGRRDLACKGRLIFDILIYFLIGLASHRINQSEN